MRLAGLEPAWYLYRGIFLPHHVTMTTHKDVVVWTISSPYHINDLGGRCIVSTHLQNKSFDLARYCPCRSSTELAAIQLIVSTLVARNWYTIQ